MTSSPLKLALENLHKRINLAAQKYQKDPSNIRILGASKFQSIDKIQELASYGQLWFGENYTQELLDKASHTSKFQIQWSYIGTLQSNKIKKLVAACSEIQTITSIDHLRLTAKSAQLFNKTPFPVYLSVNFEDEASKSGCKEEELPKLVEEAMSLPQLCLKGIMAIPSYELSLKASQDPENSPELYGHIASVAKTIGQGHLSLGMSLDLEAAIACGSSCVRIGTDLFGPRK